MKTNSCLCFVCKGCKNKGLVCKEEIDLENPCWNCSNGITVECSGYLLKLLKNI